MAGPFPAWFAVILVASAATGNLVARDWRWNLGLVAAQYLGAAVLAAAHWPVGMAAALLVTGWMSIAALGMTLSSLPVLHPQIERSWPQGLAFRLFMAGTIFVLAGGLAPRADAFVPGIEASVVAGTVLLVGIGFLELGTSDQILRIILGLLTVLTGFEVFYAAVEGSILVVGMLSTAILGLGLTGAHLLNLSQPEESE
ncbi:MAG TPA: hypothetical protein VIU38_11945 [Anaerolineales bacterium]